MKKILIIFMIMLMVSGCTKSQDQEILFVKNDKKYALCVDGEVKTDYIYSSFETVSNQGFVVHEGKKDSYIDREGKEKIAYKKGVSLQAINEIIVAQDEDDYIIYDSSGKKLYESDKNVKISLFDLPVIEQDKQYTVLDGKGQTVTNTKSKINYVGLYNTFVTVCYSDSMRIFDVALDPQIDKKGLKVELSGQYKILDADMKGYLLYDAKQSKLAYINDKGEIQFKMDKTVDSAEMDDETIIAKKDDMIYLISLDGSVDVKATSYYKNSNQYLIKNDNYIYGPHQFVNKGKTEEVTGIQLNPEITGVQGNLFPVYVQSKGYQYYDFTGKAKIKTYYKYCGDFTKDQVAIVSEDGEKYYMIDKNGEKLSKKYVKMEVIGHGYYAGYESSTKFVVLNAQGEQVIDDYFMGTCDIYTYDEQIYGLFNKSGTTHVYNMSNQEEMFTLEGEYKVYQERYLVSSNYKKYYDMSGNLYYKR